MMWRMVLDDLYYGVKSGFKYISKYFMCYLFIYFLGILPLTMKVPGRYLPLYYAGMVPMILAIFLTIIYGEDVGALFFCPFSESDRKQYFLISWGMRVLLPTLFCLLFEGVFCVMGFISPKSAFLCLLTVMFFSAVMGLQRGFMNRSAAKQNRISSGFLVWEVVILFLGIITMCFLGAVVGDMEEPRFTGMEVEIMLVLFFLHGVAAIFVILRYVKPAMEYIIYYEKVERGKESSAD